MAAITLEIERLIEMRVAGVVYEEDGRTVRMFNGCHLQSELLTRFCRDPRVLRPATQLLGEAAYVHRCKYNQKNAFIGDVWEWHQDFLFWNREDGIPEPRILTVALLLDEVTEFNAPLTFIPRRIRGRLLIDREQSDPSGSAWTGNTVSSRKLKYHLDREQISSEVAASGLEAPKGASGSLLVFDCDVLHCSSVNISPFHRRILFVTYNAVSNCPRADFVGRRPEFLSGTNFAPVEPLPVGGFSRRGCES
jgi:ectoine hydroxylase